MARRAILGAFAVFAASACNAILGMEHARLDEDVDSGAGNHGTGGRPPTPPAAGGSASVLPTECSVPTEGCAQCVQDKCAIEMSDCLASPDCRRSLEGYGKCVSSKCQSSGTCGENLASSVVPAAAALGLCLAGCGGDCAKGTAISMCEPYCACMMEQCAGQFRIDLGGSVAKCVENCKTKSDILANVDCRAAHCEYAPDDPVLHCNHAVGMGFCPLPDLNDTQVCTSGTETGYPCHMAKECCSGNCQRQVCVSAD